VYVQIALIGGYAIAVYRITNEPFSIVDPTTGVGGVILGACFAVYNFDLYRRFVAASRQSKAKPSVPSRVQVTPGTDDDVAHQPSFDTTPVIGSGALCPGESVMRLATRMCVPSSDRIMDCTHQQILWTEIVPHCRTL
jgi:hypothetical protein